MTHWTVYFVGAGFAKACQLPQRCSQPVLLSELLPAIYEHTNEYRELKDFCRRVFGARAGQSIPSIQDIFTVIDGALQADDSVGGFDTSELHCVRDVLCKAVAETLADSLKEVDGNLRAAFGNLVKSQYSQTAVITTNWDIILDKALLEQDSGGSKGCVWYGVDTHSYGDHERWMPYWVGLKQDPPLRLARLLKLHGSANWLWCKTCGRLYVAYGSKVVLDYFHRQQNCCCRYCIEQSTGTGTRRTFRLSPVMLMPTFLQSYGQPHISTIWHRALKELRRAEKIIIMGYSLPTEDYYVRNLFARAMASRLTDKPHIEVVLRECDRCGETRERYKSFFGDYLGDNSFRFEGIEDYLRGPANGQ